MQIIMLDKQTMKPCGILTGTPEEIIQYGQYQKAMDKDGNLDPITLMVINGIVDQQNQAQGGETND